MRRLRIILLTIRDLLGYCDPPFWPKWEYDNDPRLRWMLPEKKPDKETP